MTDVAEIAARLSDAQKQRLLGEEDGNCPAGIAFTFMAFGLMAAHPTDPQGWVWSQLGQDVRAHLLAKDQNHG